MDRTPTLPGIIRGPPVGRCRGRRRTPARLDAAVCGFHVRTSTEMSRTWHNLAQFPLNARILEVILCTVIQYRLTVLYCSLSTTIETAKI